MVKGTSQAVVLYNKNRSALARPQGDNLYLTRFLLRITEQDQIE